MIKKCLKCNKEFKSPPSGAKCCSTSCAHKGKIPWWIKNNEINPFNKPEIREKLKKLNKLNTGNKNHFFNKKHTLKSREKISETHKGQIPWNKNKTGIYSEKTIEKIRKARLNQTFNKKDSSIELRMGALLKSLGVEYQKQVPLYKIAIVDFYIPSKNLVIQVDGCYWHGCPEHFPNRSEKREKDLKQDQVLENNGLKVIRFWEHEIMSPNFKLLMLQ